MKDGYFRVDGRTFSPHSSDYNKIVKEFNRRLLPPKVKVNKPKVIKLKPIEPMAQRQTKTPPPEAVFIPASPDGLKVYCPILRAYIVFRTAEKRDRWVERYKTQDAMRIDNIIINSRKPYDQIRKYENK